MTVPTGLIAIWSGTLASIPANWNLCDGTGGTPNLIARFIRGAPAGNDPGATGGADSHTHASMTSAGSHLHTVDDQAGHTHIVNSAGAHVHSTATLKAASYSQMGASAGAHQHTTNASSSHGHTWSNAANHTHTISSDDGRPPYYEVAFIQAGAGAAVATGIIIIWTGTLATIPAGWSLCDGGGGRPDLRSRFIRGVNTSITNPGTIGGATTHIHTEGNATHNHTTSSSGSHTHTHNAYIWTHNHNTASGDTGGTFDTQADTHAGDHTHAATNDPGGHTHDVIGDISHSHTVNTASSLPAYYQVAYIINTGASAIPANGILIWTGTLLTIPSLYSLCDGTGGKPELRSKFIYGSAAGVDPGGTGGSDTHTHTDQNGGAHNTHTQTTAGAHQHNNTDTLGFHTHVAGGPSALNGGASGQDPSYVSGLHAHTFNSEGGHTHANQSDPGNHNHNNWSTDDGRPAYYEVAFVIYAGAPTAYKDTATRFKLTVRNYVDIATRFKLIARSFTDTATRFRLIVQGYKDIATRFRLTVQGFTDIATRFALQVQSYRDIATRFLLHALGYTDTKTRFILVGRNYCDTATRFYLIAPPSLWHEWMFESDNYILQGRPGSSHCRT